MPNLHGILEPARSCTLRGRGQDFLVAKTCLPARATNLLLLTYCPLLRCLPLSCACPFPKPAKDAARTTTTTPQSLPSEFCCMPHVRLGHGPGAPFVAKKLRAPASPVRETSIVNQVTLPASVADSHEHDPSASRWGTGLEAPSRQSDLVGRRLDICSAAAPLI